MLAGDGSLEYLIITDANMKNRIDLWSHVDFAHFD